MTTLLLLFIPVDKRNEKVRKKKNSQLAIEEQVDNWTKKK